MDETVKLFDVQGKLSAHQWNWLIHTQGTYHAFPEDQFFMSLEMWDSCIIEVISCILWYNSRMHAKLKMVGQEFVITEGNNGDLEIGVQLQVWLFRTEHVIYFVGRKVSQCICSESKKLVLIVALYCNLKVANYYSAVVCKGVKDKTLNYYFQWWHSTTQKFKGLLVLNLICELAITVVNVLPLSNFSFALAKLSEMK